MHICLDFRPALRRGTGVGTYVQNLALALAESFPDNVYTVFSASWKDRVNGLEAGGALRICDRKIPVRALDWAWHRWRHPVVERLVGAIDIAHSPSPMLLPTRRARSIVTIFDCHFLRHPDDVFGTVQRDYVPLARRSAAAADAIVVGSRSGAAEVEEQLGVAADKIAVIPLGVESVFFEASAADAIPLLQRYGVEPPFLLFAGRRERRKNLGTLLRAADALAAAGHAFNLVLVGPDAPGWDETWAAAPARVRDLTRIVPHQPVGSLAALYAAASTLVMPSRWEGFGLTGLEAMAAGTPVVAARVGSLPEVLGDAATFVDASDAAEMARQCGKFLADSELVAVRRQTGLDHARGFRWSDTARRTHELYRRLLD